MMDSLLVDTPELKSEYQERNRLWEKYYKRFSLMVAWLLWRNNVLIHYPLVIDIKLGNMKYHYLQYGLKRVLIRINLFNRILVTRISDKSIDLDPDTFYITTVLTSREDIEKQLEKELRQVCLN